MQHRVFPRHWALTLLGTARLAIWEFGCIFPSKHGRRQEDTIAQSYVPQNNKRMAPRRVARLRLCRERPNLCSAVWIRDRFNPIHPRDDPTHFRRNAQTFDSVIERHRPDYFPLCVEIGQLAGSKSRYSRSVGAYKILRK